MMQKLVRVRKSGCVIFFIGISKLKFLYYHNKLERKIKFYLFASALSIFLSKSTLRPMTKSAQMYMRNPKSGATHQFQYDARTIPNVLYVTH